MVAVIDSARKHLVGKGGTAWEEQQGRRALRHVLAGALPRPQRDVEDGEAMKLATTVAMLMAMAAAAVSMTAMAASPLPPPKARAALEAMATARAMLIMAKTAQVLMRCQRTQTSQS